MQGPRTGPMIGPTREDDGLSAAVEAPKPSRRRRAALGLALGLGIVLVAVCIAVITTTSIQKQNSQPISIESPGMTEIQQKDWPESVLTDHPDKESWLECHGADVASCREVKELEAELEQEVLRLYAPDPGKVTDGEGDGGTIRWAQDNPLSDGMNTEPKPDPDQEPDEQIYLTPEQLRHFKENLVSRGKRRRKRKLRVFTSSSGKWELPIRYKFDGSHSDGEKEKIRQAIRHWESHTCLRFLELETSSQTQDPHILFTSHYGCGSYIGRVAITPQQVDLVSRCITSTGTVAHEIGHAIGFWHEHQRSDRDAHVTIRPENAWKTMSFVTEFERLGKTNNLVPYDYASVLHYGSKMLSVNGKLTIETNDPIYQRVIGQRVGLSFLDSKLANLAYCPNLCPRPLPVACQHNGYQDPNDCSRCRCPDGFTGIYCDQVSPGVGASCGGRIHVGSQWQRLETPGYSDVRNYEDFQACSWLLVAPPGHQVVMMFEEDFGLYCKDLACYHWAEIRYSTDLSQTGPRFCCQVRPLDPMRSESNEVLVLFRSDYETYIWSRRGFRLVFFAEPRSGSAGYPRPIPTTTTTTTTPRPTTTRRQWATPARTTTPKPRPQPPQPSIPDSPGDFYVDITFLLDSSGSVGAGNWDRLLYFVVMFIRAIEVGPHQAQVAVVSYGNSATLHFDLDDYRSSYELLRAVDSIPWKDQMTNTSGAIKVAREDVFTSAGGDRRGAPNVAILITDGASNRDQTRTKPEAALARWAGIKMFVVGVGDNLDMNEIEDIVSRPMDKHLHLIRYFDDMLDYLDDIKSAVFSYADTSSTKPSSTSTTTSGSRGPLPPGSVGSQPGKADVALILDSSGSVGQVNWYKMLDFIKSFVRKLDVNGGAHRVGVVSFGSRAFVEFNLDSYTDLSRLLDAVDSIRWRDEMTNTSGGIKTGRTEIFNANLGDRPAVANIGIIITDGASNRGSARVQSEAEQARREGISLLVIGVGKQLDDNELRDIVGSHQDRIVHVDSFDRLFTVESDILRLMYGITGSSRGPTNVPRPTPPVDPPTGCQKVDLAFVVDSSGSIGQNNWPRMLHFVRTVAESFRVGYEHVLVSVVTFGNQATLNFGLQAYPHMDALTNAIDHIRWKDQWTNTSGGLHVMRTQAFGQNAGSRQDAIQVGILITDGRSNRDETLTFPEAHMAKTAGITMLALGVGKNVDLDELMGIASDPDSTFTFFAESFSELPSLAQDVHDLVCHVSSTTARPAATQRTPTPAPTPPPRPSGTSTSRQKCRDLDFAFLLDASSSKSDFLWGKLREFVKDFIREIHIGESANNIALLSYAQNTFVDFFLNEFYSKQSILDAIDDVPQINQWRDLSSGFYEMRSRVFTEVRGDRPRSKNIAILVTDGKTNRNKHLVVPEADSLKSLGTELYVVGVSDNVDADELVKAASSPDVTHAYFARSYENLNDVRLALLTAICGPATHDPDLHRPPVAMTTPVYHLPATATGWGTWSECTMQCGGCGRRYRYARCPDAHGRLQNCGNPQAEQCNERACSEHDTCHFVVASRQYTRPCHECCQGYRRYGDTCVPG